jgi:UMF1 family MFS transporter
MYDWAKSAFETTIMAAVLPIYYADVAGKGLPENLRTAYWGYTTGLGLLIISILSPLLGAIADTSGTQKRMLLQFSVAAAIASGLLWYVGEGDWMLASLLYIVANIGYAGANVFYDALLPYIATPDEIDRTSTAGYALGYVGGGILLAVNLAWITKPDLFGFADKGVAVRASFLSVAVWWLVFMWPTQRYVREPAPTREAREAGSAVAVAWRRIIDTFRQVRRYKQVCIFLVSFWFYTDGIGTIIKMATIFGREIGIGTTHLIGALILVQFLGIPATFAFGAIAERIGAKASIVASLFVYAGICVLGYFMSEAWHFWALAVLVALVQGGSQALSRSLYATLVPLSKASEFFSFISVSARFAGILGPILFGLVAQFSGGSRLSILFLISFFVVGIVLLLKVDVPEGQRVAAEAEAELQRRRLD